MTSQENHMNRKLAAVILVFAAAAGYAQSIAHQAIASQFNNWRAPGTTNLVAAANTLVPITSCSLNAGGVNFYAVSASTPVKINDPGNPAIDEIITPTTVVQGGSCTVTLTPSNAHPAPWYLTSGTAGLQEAINATGLSGQINPIILDTNWHQSGGNQQVAYNAAGNYNAPLLDVTIAPSVSFRWNGTHYLQTYAIDGVAASTIAAGAAAGSSPTVSVATGSSGNLMVANVTTGTATTTGTLFTITIPTAPPNSSGNPACVGQSIGANNFPVVLTLAGASTTTFTGAVSVAPPVSTAYVFAISCN
jgi:hypothetical protein